jgi:hypothetical protein
MRGLDADNGAGFPLSPIHAASLSSAGNSASLVATREALAATSDLLLARGSGAEAGAAPMEKLGTPAERALAVLDSIICGERVSGGTITVE